VLNEAGNRTHGTTRAKPLKRFAEVEKALLRPLPAALPEAASWAKAKTILEKGLDQQTLLSAFDALAATYTEGGRFCRDTQTILQ
jgi:hypothetical protein